MLYDDWLGRMAKTFQKRLDDIEAVYNTELGDEFEIAIATLLRGILPPRYGVCRGWVVARDGTKAGDDIIIYDRDRFPVLRMLGEDLSLLQKVPADAVFAYIEAKHNLTTTAAKKDKASLPKALRQVHEVRKVLDSRPRVPLSALAPGVSLGPLLSTASPPGWPSWRNPSYVAIWARSYEAEDRDDLVHEIGRSSAGGNALPNFLVAGDVTMLPVIERATGPSLKAHFCGPNAEPAFAVNVGAPFGIAVAHLLFAIEHCQLGDLPWPEMLIEQINQPGTETLYIEPVQVDSQTK